MQPSATTYRYCGARLRPLVCVLAAVRNAGMAVIHTREGHRPDLSDLPPAKKARGRLVAGIGDAGPMGRILVRGEPGHDIIPELYPLPGEPVVDKPGKGAFHATDLDAMLKNRGITQLVVCGVTTEVCVNTTVREANDRGYDCLVLADCVGSYFPEFQEIGTRNDQGTGRHFRLGRIIGRRDRGAAVRLVVEEAVMNGTAPRRAGGSPATGTVFSAYSPMSSSMSSC